MKTITTLLALHLAAVGATAQFRVDFANTATTLISAGGVPMSPSERFRFALFLGPGTAVTGPGITTAFTDPTFQQVDAYTTNTLFMTGAGRLQRLTVDITAARLEEVGFWESFGMDFVVRGWSANAGATWSEALANWNNGSPLVPMFIGSSTVGNDLIPAVDALPDPRIFGTWPIGEVLGFDMVFVPEPSALALTVLGGATLWVRVWRKRRKST